MSALRISVVSLALCSLFAGSLVRADDCGDSLMAEPCAGRSDIRSGSGQPRNSPLWKGGKGARVKIAQQEAEKVKGKLPHR